jgi:antitoxin MazE
VRVPKDIATRVGLREGSRVQIEAEGNRILISVARPVYRLDELLDGMTPESMREAFDWGDDAGREVVDRRTTSRGPATSSGPTSILD